MCKCKTCKCKRLPRLVNLKDLTDLTVGEVLRLSNVENLGKPTETSIGILTPFVIDGEYVVAV